MQDIEKNTEYIKKLNKYSGQILKLGKFQIKNIINDLKIYLNNIDDDINTCNSILWTLQRKSSIIDSILKESVSNGDTISITTIEVMSNEIENLNYTTEIDKDLQELIKKKLEMQSKQKSLYEICEKLINKSDEIKVPPQELAKLPDTTYTPGVKPKIHRNPMILRGIDRKNSLLREMDQNVNVISIKRKEIVELLSHRIEILNFVSFEEIYVRINHHADLERDNEFIKSLQDYYNSHRCYILDTPRQGMCAVVRLDDGLWHRCRIVTLDHTNSDCKVFLVDSGRCVKVDRIKLKELEKDMANYNQISIKCAMANIKIHKHMTDYPKVAYDEFKILTMDCCYTLKICATAKKRSDYVDEALSCNFYICGIPNCKKINFNVYMVQHNYADVTGYFNEDRDPFEVDSEAEYEQEKLRFQKNEENENRLLEEQMKKVKLPPMKRIPVKVLSIKSPDEFYIASASRVNEIKQLYQKIQASSIGMFPSDELNEGEMCLVEDNLFLYRGIVLEKTDDDYLLFLVDEGREIKTNLTKMRKISQEIRSVPHAAIKAHLYEVYSTNGKDKSWSSSLIDVFRMIKTVFDNFVVCVFEKSQTLGNDSLPVVLWGVQKKLKVVICQQEYHNINLYLYNNGYVNTNLKPDFFENLADPYTFEIVAKTSDEIIALQEQSKKAHEPTIEIAGFPHPVNFMPKKIRSWIPSENKYEMVFNGIPTHVGKDGEIYIVTMESYDMVEQLAKEMKKVYQSMANTTETQLKPGDCVIALFKDQGYYRAEVIRRSTKHCLEYLVRYMDYGTTHYVNRAYIYTDVVAENIPIQANRFVFYNLMPDNENNQWNQKDLDEIHQFIVGRECEIKVVQPTKIEGVMGMELNVLQLDMDDSNEERGQYVGDAEKYIVKNNFARYRDTDDEWPVKFKNQDIPLIDDNLPSIQIIQKIIHAQKMNEQKESKELSYDFKEHIEAKTHETNRLLKKKVSFHTYVDKFISSSGEEEDTLRSYKFRNPKKFSRRRRHILKISKFDFRSYDRDEYDVFLHGIVDPANLTFLVAPLVEEFKLNHESIMKEIRHTPRNTLTRFRHGKLAVAKYCIAITNNERFRGFITNYDEKSNNATVELIDLGVFEDISLDNLYKLENKFMMCERAVVKVKYYNSSGLVYNNMAEDIEMKFRKTAFKIMIKSYDNEENCAIAEFKDLS